jgi:hypothetical protein
MSGFIKLYRGWHKSDLFTDKEPYCDRAAWLWLVENAAWKDVVRYNHKGESVMIERGQIHVSLSSLETTFNWSKKKVRGFLVRLEIRHMAGIKRAQDGTTITICNYCKYQDVPDAQGHSQGTVKGTARAQLGHTQEEHKKEKKVRRKKDIGFFKPSDVSDLVWNDWVAMREAKKLSISQTVISGIVREADKAGWTLDAAIAEMVTRGWQGFKSEWVSEKENRNGQTKNRDGFIEALDIARDNLNFNQAGIKRIG